MALVPVDSLIKAVHQEASATAGALAVREFPKTPVALAAREDPGVKPLVVMALAGRLLVAVRHRVEGQLAADLSLMEEVLKAEALLVVEAAPAMAVFPKGVPRVSSINIYLCFEVPLKIMDFARLTSTPTCRFPSTCAACIIFDAA